MGQMLAEEVAAAGATLVGGVCRPGEDAKGAKVFPDIAALAAACDLVIDFTHASTVQTHAAALAGAGIAWVLGRGASLAALFGLMVLVIVADGSSAIGIDRGAEGAPE